MAENTKDVLTPPAVRPLGVRLGAVLLLLFAIFGLAGAFLGLLIRRGYPALTFFYLLDALIAVVELITVWGLWKLRPWAFWATIYVEALCIVIAFIPFLIWHDATSLVTNLAFPVVILLCLLLDPTARVASRRQ